MGFFLLKLRTRADGQMGYTDTLITKSLQQRF